MTDDQAADSAHFGLDDDLCDVTGSQCAAAAEEEEEAEQHLLCFT
jgi:hypothetical protein